MQKAVILQSYLMNCLGSAGCGLTGTLCGFWELCSGFIKEMKVTLDEG